MRSKILIRGGAGLAVLTIAVAACGGSGGSGASGSGASGTHSASPTKSMPPMGATGKAGSLTSTAGANLYAALDQLLVEHVDLTSNVVQTAITKGASSAQTKAALAALDQNTQGLGKLIGSAYGDAAQREFLKQWRAHIGFFVSYTLGVATKNHAQVAMAKKNLDGYVSMFSTFLAGATKLPKSAVAADLQGHVATLETAINAIVAKSPSAGHAIEMAAMHMAGTAEVLAKGIASSKGIAGNVAGASSSLRASLTGLLIQHVAATAFVVQTAVAAGGSLTAPEVKGAISALSDNTNQLGAAIGSVYGAAAQKEFLTMWRAHIGYFVSYTLGVATKNNAQVTKAKKNLEGYTTKFAAFMAGATKLPKSALVADLQGHVSTLETAISSIVVSSPSASGNLLVAENHMAGTGAVLAAGIAASMPSKFSS